MTAQLWEYRAVVLGVVDGDTIDVRTDLGFDANGLKMRLRLLGVDCPERADRERWDAAKKYTAAWLSEHADNKGRVFIRTQPDTHDADEDDSFGRYLATVYNLTGGDTCGDHCLNAALLDSGNAVVYDR